MEVNVIETSAVSKTLKVEFDWAEIADIYAEIFKDMRKNFKLAGFRKGKVPEEIARHHLAPDVEYKCMEQVIKDNISNVIKQAGIANYLDFKILQLNFDEGKPFIYHLLVEFDPQIELPNYKKGFKLTRKKYIIDPESVDEVIARIQEENAIVTETDGPIAEGHFVLCDLQELDQTYLPIIGRKLTDKIIKVGEGIFGGEDTAGLIGASAGDKVTVRLPRQDGTKLPYQISIKRVHTHTLPEIDDAFVKATYKEMETVADLCQRITESLEHEYAHLSDKELEQAIIDYFLKNTDFELPGFRVNWYLDRLIEDYKKNRQDQEVDEEQLRAQYRPQAERTVRWYLIQKTIREQENIKVEESEVKQMIEQIQASYPEDKRAAVAEFYQDHSNRLDLVWDLLEQKVIAFIKKFVTEKVETVHTKEAKSRRE